MTTTHALLCAAHAARGALAASDIAQRDDALRAMAAHLQAEKAAIVAASQQDVADATGQLSEAMLDRLLLTDARFDGMTGGLLALTELPDPLGRTLWETVRPNGLHIRKVAVPMGVIAIIYESRPNVTADAAALCIKSGNVCVLRCGRACHRTAQAIVAAMQAGLAQAGLPPKAVQLVQDTSHDSAAELMTANGLVDLLIPRGGAGLIRACVQNATVPCIQTGTGICHIYVEKTADLDMALDIVENAKASRPSVCNAAEVCLVDRQIAAGFLPRLATRLGAGRVARGLPPVELRLDAEAAGLAEGTPAGPQDFDTEFLAYVLGVKVVEGPAQAMEHIAAHSTGHSEAIITRDKAAARAFTAGVDSAAVYVNASTRFTDGGEFGFGCEMGISTQKLHARGPMGLAELCSYKYIIQGTGQIR